MEKKDFPKGTKPREIFVYTCERIAEPLNPLGYKYRKSKNDIYKKDGIFVFSFYFSPSIRFGSTTFTAFFDVSSPVIAQWRSEQEGTEETYDGIVLSLIHILCSGRRKAGSGGCSPPSPTRCWERSPT